VHAARQVEHITAGLHAGAGYAWSGAPVPLVALGAGLVVGRGRLRLVLEGERGRDRVTSEESRTRYAFGPPDREIETRTVRRTQWQVWQVARLGVMLR
jgi:hypothetical protein